MGPHRQAPHAMDEFAVAWFLLFFPVSHPEPGLARESRWGLVGRYVSRQLLISRRPTQRRPLHCPVASQQPGVHKTAPTTGADS